MDIGATIKHNLTVFPHDIANTILKYIHARKLKNQMDKFVWSGDIFKL